MRWFLPSFNGDFRLEHVEKLGEAYRSAPGGPAADTAGVKLVVTQPTAHERELLTVFLSTAVEKKWTAIAALPEDDCEIVLAATMADAGQALVKISKPMDRTITAVQFTDGKLKVVDAAQSGVLVAAAEKAEKKLAGTGMFAKAGEAAKKAGGAVAATVARATPSCPQCVLGSVEMASEVLLSFLNEEEHDDWAKRRAIIVTGGYTGRRYILAHRHSKLAQKFGRICYGIDDKMVVHFHDNSVPPEEEVLGAKLIIEHREHWLRNEATMLGNWKSRQQVFKNPFGDISDGTWDSSFTEYIGNGLAALLGDKLPEQQFNEVISVPNPYWL